MKKKGLPSQHLIFVLGLVALIGLGVRCPESSTRAPETEPEAAASPPGPVLPAPELARAGSVVIADVAEKRVVSVVNIWSEKVVRSAGGEPRGPFFDDPFFRHFFGERFFSPEIPRERRERSLGSGVIVSEDGVVLTNNHVVEKAEDVRVTLSDGRQFEAKIVGTDPKTDIAVVRLQGDIGKLEPLPFGDSDRLRLGDVVLAIGNPFGVGQTVTMGIVSAKGRANVGIVDYEDFIQTDAAINPGNSGGALIDTNGDLAGINTAIVSRSGGYQGIGFAIPSNMARFVLTSLLETGKVVRGWLGVVIQEVTPDLAGALHLEGAEGVLVSDVAKDSPAEKAGLERGDVILRLDGQKIDSTGHLRNRVAAAGAGAEVKLDVLRDGKERAITVKLGELPAEVGERASLEGGGDTALGGLSVAPLDEMTRRRFGIPPMVESGVVVTQIEPGSPAFRAGLRPGDVVREIDQKPVGSVAEFRERYSSAGAAVLLLVQRGNSVLFVPLRKEG